MKIVLATLCLSISTVMINAVAIPEENGSYTSLAARWSLDDLVLVNMTVYDPRFPGVTFTGDAKSVNQQMGHLKPGDFPDLFEPSEARSLAKWSTLNCNYGTDILGPKSCHNNLGYLRALNRANCCVNGGLGACARVACSNTCGNFLCNKTNSQFCASCRDISTDLQYIKDHCEHAKVATASGARDFDTHFVEQSGTNGC